MEDWGLQRLGMSGRLQGLHCLSCPNRQISVRGWEGEESVNFLLVQHSQITPHMHLGCTDRWQAKVLDVPLLALSSATF